MINRGRRLRVNSSIRDLVRENTLTSNDFIYPIFVVEGENIKREISGWRILIDTVLLIRDTIFAQKL